MIRPIIDMLICAYALAVIRGYLATIPHATLMTLIFAVFCGWQLRNSWKAQGLWA